MLVDRRGHDDALARSADQSARQHVAPRSSDRSCRWRRRCRDSPSTWNIATCRPLIERADAGVGHDVVERTDWRPGLVDSLAFMVDLLRSPVSTSAIRPRSESPPATFLGAWRAGSGRAPRRTRRCHRPLSLLTKWRKRLQRLGIRRPPSSTRTRSVSTTRCISASSSARDAELVVARPPRSGSRGRLRGCRATLTCAAGGRRCGCRTSGSGRCSGSASSSSRSAASSSAWRGFMPPLPQT